MPQQPIVPARQAVARLRSLWQRWFLWVLLALLVMVLLGTVVWLAGRHEADQVQAALDRDTSDAVAELRGGLQRNAQSLNALMTDTRGRVRWPEDEATALLRAHREWVRLEWRDPQLQLRAAADSPYRVRLFDEATREASRSDIALACAAASKLGGAAYSPSHYVPVGSGTGVEVMEICLPSEAGDYLIASYAMRETLIELVGPSLRRGQEVAFAEPDGTRLATVGAPRRGGNRIFTSQQLIDLPGVTLMLRVDGWRAEPDLFPNLLTGLVTGVSIALISVLILLARDTRRRLRAERELADTLAFRKAMEDSVITGLRARDLQGRITYANPAFCAMVGFSLDELIGRPDAPYWPTELVHEYQQRQTLRLAGGMPPREGFESVYMRKNGTRFPVLIFEAPLLNAQRVQTGWMSAFIDVSEQRRVEELSRASQERLQASARLATVGEMASLLSHELTQPLAAIASYATGSLNLLDGEPDGAPAELAMALRRIGEQAERAGQVIRSVHDFVRRRDRTREAVSPRALIDAVLPLVQLQARKLGVRIDIVLERDLPQVLCDRTLVEQVLLNLARNAMQAMDVAGIDERVLLIRAARGGGSNSSSVDSAGEARRWLEFSVADIGSGISDEVAKRLFTPFFTTRSDGMGLGLSLCRTVVEQHGGALLFEPNRPRGTIFRFTLLAAVPTAPLPLVTESTSP
ncbi:PAS domain S-box protein [Variovorax sp. J22G21]|uniref:sensor histidine kinase n=1 Tax=Variovorax fucosicus TaxID=3053517 RepID=UPI002577D330|nr:MULTISPECIES: PAS domain S-box protein [unclassified Variovorax]MDM0039501.1 PAS domain S-box protein [Variovorax sp. J22R193]MDM0054887.1 PAS domain S-box protein [Variovorax sp. J22G47]MDM0064276.1 PAS domain S-box protein [Variovorax sp. J22G21]